MIEVSTIQLRKAEAFRALHLQPAMFVIPNAWDIGSAKILTGLDYKAIATTSAGLAYSIGKPDGRGLIPRDIALWNAANIVHATHLPVSADLENGYSDDPEDVALTIRLAASTGLVGGSIEDSTGKTGSPIYDFNHSVERISAAVAAARSLPFPFMLTARAENYLHGRSDLDDTIKRLVAYSNAGADVLFAPAVKNALEIKAIVAALAPKPVNVVWGFSTSSMTVHDLSMLGVRRLSTGSSLARAAYGALLQGAKELRTKGSFDYANHAIPYAEANQLFDPPEQEENS